MSATDHFWARLRLCVLPWQVQKARPDLRVIISSATMEAEALASYFDACTDRRKQARTASSPSLQSSKVSCGISCCFSMSNNSRHVCLL